MTTKAEFWGVPFEFNVMHIEHNRADVWIQALKRLHIQVHSTSGTPLSEPENCDNIT